MPIVDRRPSPPGAPVHPPVLPRDRASWDALAHEVARRSEHAGADPAFLAVTVAALEAALGLTWPPSDRVSSDPPVVLARRFARIHAEARRQADRHRH
jgi:hypothetical protein